MKFDACPDRAKPVVLAASVCVCKCSKVSSAFVACRPSAFAQAICRTVHVHMQISPTTARSLLTSRYSQQEVLQLQKR